MAGITEEMVIYAYNVGEKVYTGKLTLDNGINILVSQYNMNKRSAFDYIHNYECLISGEKYTRTMNEYATKYFLTKILIDKGINSLKTALEAVEKHLEYQDDNGYNNLVNIKELHKKYTALVENDCLKVVKKIFELL
jgi:5-methylcytosine-specific restriction protein A